MRIRGDVMPLQVSSNTTAPSTRPGDARRHSPASLRLGVAGNLGQLLIRREVNRSRGIDEEWSQNFPLPDLPVVRILPLRSRTFRRAPQALPCCATLVDPDGGVPVSPNTLLPL